MLLKQFAPGHQPAFCVKNRTSNLKAFAVVDLSLCPVFLLCLLMRNDNFDYEYGLCRITALLGFTGGIMSARSISHFDRIIGANIRRARIMRDQSMEELARCLKLSLQQLSKYEKGVNRITAGRLFEIANILNVSVLTFYRGLKREETVDEVSKSQTLYVSAEGVRFLEAFENLDDQQFRNAILQLMHSRHQEEMLGP